jgi:hypothetical protein
MEEELKKSPTLVRLKAVAGYTLIGNSKGKRKQIPSPSRRGRGGSERPR